MRIVQHEREDVKKKKMKDKKTNGMQEVDMKLYGAVDGRGVNKLTVMVTLVNPENIMKSRLKNSTPRYSPPSKTLSGLRVVRKNRVAVMMATRAHWKRDIDEYVKFPTCTLIFVRESPAAKHTRAVQHQGTVIDGLGTK